MSLGLDVETFVGPDWSADAEPDKPWQPELPFEPDKLPPLSNRFRIKYDDEFDEWVLIYGVAVLDTYDSFPVAIQGLDAWGRHIRKVERR